MRLAWVLTVEADRIMRWSSQDIVLTEGGTRVECATGLAVDDVVESLEGAADSTVVAMPLQDGLSLPRLMEVVRSAWVDLALVQVDAEGSAEWNTRLAVAGGRVGDIEVEPARQLVSLRIGPLDMVDTADLVPESVAVEDRTWPQAPDSARGLRPPLVYGRPGSYAYETVTDADLTPTYDFTYAAWGAGTSVTWQQVRQTRTAGVSPAFAVQVGTYTYALSGGSGNVDVDIDGQWIAIALGHAPATEVELWIQLEKGGPNQGGWETRAATPTTHAYDGRGHPVTVIDISGLDEELRRAGAWMIAWTELGGLDGPPGCERGALGAVIIALLQRSAARIDWSSVSRAAAYLDRFTVGGYIDDTITPVEWCQNRLPTYGASIRWSRGGMGIVVQDPTASPIAVLDLDRDGHLDGPVVLARPEADEVVVTWADAPRTAARQARSRVVRADAPVTHPQVATIAAAEVWESATAMLVGEHHLRRLGPRMDCVVLADLSTWWWVRPGDVLDLVHEQLGWAAGPGSRWVVVRAQHTTAGISRQGAETRFRRLHFRRIEPIRLRSYATVESRKS